MEKNLHVAIPAALLIEAEATAKALCITLDELVQQAIEGYLADRRRTKLYAYGEERARGGVTTEGEVEALVHHVNLAVPEPEVLRLLGEESKQNGTDEMTSHQIDQEIKAYRAGKNNAAT